MARVHYRGAGRSVDRLASRSWCSGHLPPSRSFICSLGATRSRYKSLSTEQIELANGPASERMALQRLTGTDAPAHISKVLVQEYISKRLATFDQLPANWLVICIDCVHRQSMQISCPPHKSCQFYLACHAHLYPGQEAANYASDRSAFLGTGR